MCLVHCYLPYAFTSSVVVPIIKNIAGQLCGVNNYRANAIANACSKLLESIMQMQSVTDGYLDEDPYQFGFKCGHSTDMCRPTYVRYSTRPLITLTTGCYFAKCMTCCTTVNLIVLHDGQLAGTVRIMQSVLFNIANGVRQGGIPSHVFISPLHS